MTLHSVPLIRRMLMSYSCLDRNTIADTENLFNHFGTKSHVYCVYCYLIGFITTIDWLTHHPVCWSRCAATEKPKRLPLSPE